MTVKDNDKSQQKRLSPEEQILRRYGIHKRGNKEERKARSINELYNLRYRKKFR